MAGADGQVLIIAKDGKWMRCEIVNTQPTYRHRESAHAVTPRSRE